MNDAVCVVLSNGPYPTGEVIGPRGTPTLVIHHRELALRCGQPQYCANEVPPASRKHPRRSHSGVGLRKNEPDRQFSAEFTGSVR